MKKYGFTLAEVLLTLGIIGVIAALTTPTLVANVRNNANGAALSTTVSTLENAFTSMIAKEDADNLFDTEAWENANDPKKFAGIFGDYLSISGFQDYSDVDDIHNYYGKDNGPFVLNTNGTKNKTVDDTLASKLILKNGWFGNQAIELKSGAMVFIVNMPEKDLEDDAINAIKDKGGSLYSEAGNVWIDVNGAASPNMLGRDIFGFYLGENGKLYPLGGKDAALFESAESPQLWDNSKSSIRCLNGDIADGGYGCAARVVAEGYKINY